MVEIAAATVIEFYFVAHCKGDLIDATATIYPLFRFPIGNTASIVVFA